MWKDHINIIIIFNFLFVKKYISMKGKINLIKNIGIKMQSNAKKVL